MIEPPESNFADITDVRRVHEKSLFRRMEHVNRHYAHFGLRSLKTLESNFSDIMNVAFTKNYNPAGPWKIFNFADSNIL